MGIIPMKGLCPLLAVKNTNNTMALCHSSGIKINSVGTRASDRVRSYEPHKCCGNVLASDVCVRVREEQISGNKEEDTALAVYRVSAGIPKSFDAKLVSFDTIW